MSCTAVVAVRVIRGIQVSHLPCQNLEDGVLNKARLLIAELHVFQLETLGCAYKVIYLFICSNTIEHKTILFKTVT